METTEALARPVNYGQATPNYRKVLKMPRWINMFLRRYGVTLLALAILWGDTTVTAAIVRHNTTIDVTEKLTAQYEAEYADKLESYKQQQQAANLITGEASLWTVLFIQTVFRRLLPSRNSGCSTMKRILSGKTINSLSLNSSNYGMRADTRQD